jgi:Holliday junction resolvase RusA-like endonuclease
MQASVFKCSFAVHKHAIKKNSKEIRYNARTGSRFIASNSKAKFLEEWLVTRFRVEKLKQRIDCIGCDVNVKMVFTYPKSVYFTKDGRRSNRVADLSNLYSAVEDALQKAGVIINDSFICAHDGSKRTHHDSKEYLLSVEIHPL